MAFRSIMIESPAQLSLRDGQLVIRTEREHTVPLEDISALLLKTAAAPSQQPHWPAWANAAAPFFSAMKSISPAQC